MTHKPCPERVHALHAMLDDEIDALATVELEEHLRGCPACRRELDRLGQLREYLRVPELRDAAPAALAMRIGQMAPPMRPPRPARAWLGGAVGGALAASLAFLLLAPDLTEPGLDQAVVDGHIRSLQAGHLTDVAVSDRHVVKPWFNGRLTFAPPVPDLGASGFMLGGGRLDVLEGRDVAVLVYRRRLHTINLFVRPAPALSGSRQGLMRQAGYGVERWQMDGLEFLAVSDLDPADLAQFRMAFIRGAHSGNRER